MTPPTTTPTPTASDDTRMQTDEDEEVVVMGKEQQQQQQQQQPSASFLTCYFGVGVSQGDNPYMQDRHMIVPDLLHHAFRHHHHGSPQLGGGGGKATQPRQLIGVFDGHICEKAAEHASTRLPILLSEQPAIQMRGTGSEEEEPEVAQAIRSAFEGLDREVLHQASMEGGHRQYDGTTAVCVLRVGQVVYVAQVGDSRAVLCRDGQAMRLTRDHKPASVSEERARIEKEGGEVMVPEDRVKSYPEVDRQTQQHHYYKLAMSRSVGDPAFKSPPHPLVTAYPDVSRLPLLHGRDSFLLLASDGVFDVLSDQQAVDVVLPILADLGQRPAEAAQAAAAELVSQALQDGATDNCTAVVMVLAWD